MIEPLAIMANTPDRIRRKGGSATFKRGRVLRKLQDFDLNHRPYLCKCTLDGITLSSIARKGVLEVWHGMSPSSSHLLQVFEVVLSTLILITLDKVFERQR